MKVPRKHRRRQTAGPSAHAGAEIIGQPLPPNINIAVLRAMVVGRRYFRLEAAETKDNKTRMQLSTLISVPTETLQYWLANEGQDPEEVVVEEDAVRRLRRYQFNELEHKGDELDKTFGKEIDAAHPMNSESPTVFARHELAMKLVGERHAKHELVDLVAWLLGYKEAAEKAATALESAPSGRPCVQPDYENRAFLLDGKPLSVVEFDELARRTDEFDFGLMAFAWRSDLKRDEEVLHALGQYRNDVLNSTALTREQATRRVEMIEKTAALIPGGEAYMKASTDT